MFLYSYAADFIQGIVEKDQQKLARAFNFTFRYIVWCFVDRINPVERDIMDTICAARSVLFLDLNLEIDIECTVR